MSRNLPKRREENKSQTFLASAKVPSQNRCATLRFAIKSTYRRMRANSNIKSTLHWLNRQNFLYIEELGTKLPKDTSADQDESNELSLIAFRCFVRALVELSTLKSPKPPVYVVYCIFLKNGWMEFPEIWWPLVF